MTGDSGAAYYDQYWAERDRKRTAARSRRRAALALELLDSHSGALLEIGCGPGWALERFRDAGFDVVGVDVSRRACDDASARGLKVHALDVDSEDIPETLTGFRLVVALEVLEHLLEPLAAIQKMCSALQPGGRLIISLPNEWTLPRRISALFGRPGFGGHDDPHRRHFDPRSARRFLEAAGLRVVDCRWDSLLPPRWGFLKTLTEPLAAFFPGLFAISGVFLLEVAP